MSQIWDEPREVYKITVGLFAAAPGTVYFSALNGALEAGMSVPDLYRTLASNPPFQLQQAAFGAQSTNGQFTDAFLDQLLGNEVTSAGRQFAFEYVMHLLENGTDRGEAMRIALDALDAVPSYDPDFGAAAQRLDHRIDAAQQYTEVFGGSTFDIASLQSAIAAVTSDAATVQTAMARWRPPLLTLTSGVDAGLMFIGTSANDVFSAPAVEGTHKQTLNTFDSLSGGNGDDTLNATVGYEEARPTLHSIENVTLRFDATNPLNLSVADGIREVTVQNSTQVGTLSGVGTIGTFAVRDQRVGIVFDGSITTSLDLTFDHVGSRGSPVDFKFGTSIAVQTRTLALTRDDAHVQLTTPVAPTLNTLRIVASGENSLHLTPGWASQMILISGDGDVDFGTSPLTETTILDAATASGDLRFQADKSAVKVVTGSGNDSVTYVAPIRAGSDIDLGAGDDRLVLGGVAAPYVPINGGPGNDTIRADDGSWISREVFLNPATELPYEGFETLEAVHGQYLMPKLAGVKNVTVDQTALTDVTLVRAASDTTLTYNVQQSRTAQFTSSLNVWVQETTDAPVKLNVVLNAVDRVNDGVASGTARTNLLVTDCNVLTITSNVLQTDRSLKASDYHNIIDDLAVMLQ